jgi:hypothetical protein
MEMMIPMTFMDDSDKILMEINLWMIPMRFMDDSEKISQCSVGN